jgi:hypothetical protein
MTSASANNGQRTTDTGKKDNGQEGRTPCDDPAGGRSRESSLFRLFLGGTAGTGALAAIILFVEPLLTGKTAGLARLLGTEIGTPHGVGLIVFHFFNGSVLFPLGFAFLSARLPGPWLVKGLAWGTILWLFAEAVILPISGYGFFGQKAGGPSITAGLLAGLLAYGGLQGAIAGLPGRSDD